MLNDAIIIGHTAKTRINMVLIIMVRLGQQLLASLWQILLSVFLFQFDVAEVKEVKDVRCVSASREKELLSRRIRTKVSLTARCHDGVTSMHVKS
jgi:hypothetical protein